jgi:hypothetical protein
VGDGSTINPADRGDKLSFNGTRTYTSWSAACYVTVC